MALPFSIEERFPKWNHLYNKPQPRTTKQTGQQAQSHPSYLPVASRAFPLSSPSKVATAVKHRVASLGTGDVVLTLPETNSSLPLKMDQKINHPKGKDHLPFSSIFGRYVSFQGSKRLEKPTKTPTEDFRFSNSL